MGKPVWSRAVTPDVVSNEVGDRRLFAIVLDGFNKPQPTMRPAFQRPQLAFLAKGIREIVDAIITRLGPADVAAITGGTCFQAFTSDRDELERAVDALRPEGAPCPTRFVHPENGPAHQLIFDVARYLAAAPQRRKIVVYIGPGIDPDSGNWGARGEDDLNAAVRSAQRGNVNIYTINTLSLEGREEDEQVRMARLASLHDLAESTGGVATMDLGEYVAGIDHMFRENSAYYVLGYRTLRPELDGKGRDITVKLKGREDVVVRTRSVVTRARPGTPTGATAAEFTSKGQAFHLEGLLPDLDVAFSSDVLAYAAPDSPKTDVAVITHVAEPVTSGVTRVAQRMTVRTLVYDERGGVAASNVQQASIDLEPSIDNQVRYRVLSRFALAPGLYKVRLVAQNAETRKLGSMEFETSIPDFIAQSVSMSGVAITASPDPAASLPSFGSLEPLLPVVPTAARTFTANTLLTASMRVYQGKTTPLAPLTVVATLVDTEGRTMFESRETLAPDRFDRLRTADYQLELPLETLELRSGRHLLTFQASVGARHSPRRDVPFVVR
jgi:VWFA-related protein